MDFLTSQDTYIVCKNNMYLHSLQKQARKAHQRLSFLPVSKTRKNKFDIFQQYIVYISAPES